MTDWLTRDDIDKVLDSLSAADVIEAIGDGKQAGAAVAGRAFDSAASRLGLSNGTPATEHIRLSDFQYMADRMGEALNVDSPKSEEPEDSPPSAVTGE